MGHGLHNHSHPIVMSPSCSGLTDFATLGGFLSGVFCVRVVGGILVQFLAGCMERIPSDQYSGIL